MSVNSLSKHSNGVLGYLSGRSICPRRRQEDWLLRYKYGQSRTLHWKDLVGHYGCVNAIEFSHGLGDHVASGGDDRRILLWNVEKALSDIGKPSVMKGEHNSNIFCIAFNIDNTTIFSGGNDEQVIVHDVATGETKDVFAHEEAVYGLSADPTNPHVFASSCDDGRVLIFDTRDTCADPFVLANYTSSMHSVMYNPVEPRLLATANVKEGVGLWDVRKPRSCLFRYGGNFAQQSSMCVRFNQRGDHIVALRRRLPPVMYKLHSNEPVCEFDHSGYYNSCTMKSICFAGDNDQYILSGSDEFNLYMWAVPEDLSERTFVNSAHMVLKGHRSIVNQVRFNLANHLIISTGVEKIIKIWSPFNLPSKVQKEDSRERRVYSHEEYINFVLQNGTVISHDYSQESTEEDPRMMAFFDSLVQRELEGWSSDDSQSSNDSAQFYNRIVQLSQSDIDSDDSFPDMDDVNDINEYSPFTVAFASIIASQAADGNDRFPRLNRALENAERSNMARSEGIEITQSSEALNNVSDIGSCSDGDHVKNKELSDLVRRKKKELKEALKRRMRDCMERLSSSDDNNSDTADELSVSKSSPRNLHVDTKGVGQKMDDISKVNNEIDPYNKFDNQSDCKKHAQNKVKKFKRLREHILKSDSEASDKEIKIREKTIDDVMQPSTSGMADQKENVVKVQFKKCKRRRTEEDSNRLKEPKKSRDSLDLGPFLKQTVTASLTEVSRTSLQDTADQEKDLEKTSKLKYHKNRENKHRNSNNKCVDLDDHDFQTKKVFSKTHLPTNHKIDVNTSDKNDVDPFEKKRMDHNHKRNQYNEIDDFSDEFNSNDHHNNDNDNYSQLHHNRLSSELRHFYEDIHDPSCRKKSSTASCSDPEEKSDKHRRNDDAGGCGDHKEDTDYRDNSVDIDYKNNSNDIYYKGKRHDKSKSHGTYYMDNNNDRDITDDVSVQFEKSDTFVHNQEFQLRDKCNKQDANNKDNCMCAECGTQMEFEGMESCQIKGFGCKRPTLLCKKCKPIPKKSDTKQLRTQRVHNSPTDTKNTHPSDTNDSPSSWSDITIGNPEASCSYIKSNDWHADTKIPDNESNCRGEKDDGYYKDGCNNMDGDDDTLSTSSEEDQPTWLEFKRFKNRMTRAHKLYKQQKHNKKCNKALHTDD